MRRAPSRTARIADRKATVVDVWIEPDDHRIERPSSGPPAWPAIEASPAMTTDSPASRSSASIPSAPMASTDLHLWRMAAQMLDRGRRGRHDLLHRGRDAHPPEARHVPVACDHRVVRREPHRHPGGVQRRDQLPGALDRLETAIDDAVEVEDDEADAVGKGAHAAG